jgi:hypothetical protein
MFGRGKRSRRHASPSLLTDAASVVDSVCDALRRLECAHEVSDGAVVSLTVEAADAAIVVGESPLSLTFSADWLGLPDADAVDQRRVLNDWNAHHTVPRATGVLDEDGDARVHLDTVLTCRSGVTDAQVDEWVRRALAGVSQIVEYLDETWPDVDVVELEADRAEATAGADDVPDAAELAKADTVTLERIAASVSGETVTVQEDGASGRRGNGYIRPVGAAGAADVALHDGTLTITSGAVFGGLESMPEGTLDWLSVVCGQLNSHPDGAVAVASVTEDGEVTVTCAVHLPVGAGLTDEQLTGTVDDGLALVGARFDALIASVTDGETDA